MAASIGSRTGCQRICNVPQLLQQCCAEQNGATTQASRHSLPHTCVQPDNHVLAAMSRSDGGGVVDPTSRAGVSTSSNAEDDLQAAGRGASCMRSRHSFAWSAGRVSLVCLVYSPPSAQSSARRSHSLDVCFLAASSTGDTFIALAIEPLIFNFRNRNACAHSSADDKCDQTPMLTWPRPHHSTAPISEPGRSESPNLKVST